MHQSWSRGEFEISTDPARVDLDAVHEFLTNSYWAKGIPVETVRRSIVNSLCFGIYHQDRQVGFARVISDRATFAYLADVFVLALSEAWALQMADAMHCRPSGFTRPAPLDAGYAGCPRSLSTIWI